MRVQVGEEVVERGVVLRELLLRTTLAGTLRRRHVRVRRRVRHMAVVDVGEVAVGDRHAVLLHRRDVAERVLREHAVEAREAAVAERIGDGCARRRVDARLPARDRRVDVFRPEERLEAGVAAGLVREQVVSRPGVSGAPAVRRVAAVDRDPDEVGLRELRVGDRLVPLGRVCAEDLWIQLSTILGLRYHGRRAFCCFERACWDFQGP